MTGYLLEIVEGPEAGRTVAVGGAPLEIGREEGVDVLLAMDDLVSRHHVRISPAAEGVTVEDLGSSNGTFVDGDEIAGPAHLAPGGQLLVGVTLLELRPAVGSATSVRRVPAGLTAVRPAPAPVPPAPLAIDERKPDYVPDELVDERRATPLAPLLDVHTKSQARHAPLAVFVLVAVVVIIVLSLR